MSISTRLFRRFWHAGAVALLLGLFSMSALPVAACGGCGSVDATKAVSGTFEVGSIVTYTITLSNSMPWTQSNNPGDEFSDVLPGQLGLIGATATSGTAVANVGTNTVTWNTEIQSYTSETLTITALVKPGMEAQLVSNQGTVFYDSNGNLDNNAMGFTDDPSTLTYADPTVFTVAGEPEVIVEPVEVVSAPPPATPLCEDHNFDEGGVVHSSTADALGYAINCRVLYQNSEPTSWLGGDLYGASSIGIPGIVELGVQTAVDIFSPPGMNSFNGGAVFCLKGTGTLIWIAASGQPRHAEIIGSYEVPEWEGFTCATLFEPGTLVLVTETPAA